MTAENALGATDTLSTQRDPVAESIEKDLRVLRILGGGTSFIKPEDVAQAGEETGRLTPGQVEAVKQIPNT